MKSVVQEFKEFVLRGNVIDLAIAVVIGAAFAAVVDAAVTDLITPIIGAIGGQPNFEKITFTINGSQFMIGHFINQLVSFLIIAAVIFFLVIKPLNLLLERARHEPTPDPTTTKCPACLSEVQIGATRCPFCTSELSGQPAA